MARILILNGPNLNFLGRREPEIYGTKTLSDIEAMCREKACELTFEIDFRQSNHEGELIDWVQGALDSYEGMVINAAAYTHTSVALHDALKMLDIPIIEVHLSDTKTRETFRHNSYITPLAQKVIAGQGAEGYTQALTYLSSLVKL